MKLQSMAMLVLCVFVLTGCGGADETEPAVETGAALEPLPEGDGTHENPYVGRGFIQEIGNGELLIAHETIPGLMPAMTMAFPVTDEVDLSAFSVGDQVLFDVELGGDTGYRIIEMGPVGE